MKLLATIKKEILILVRDRAALAVLFLMPMALVFIVTLVQDAPIRQFQRSSIPLIFVDEDKDELGRAIAAGLRHSEYFAIVDSLHGRALSEEDAKSVISGGKYKVGIIVTKRATERLKARALKLFRGKFSGDSNADSLMADAAPDDSEILLLFDPAVQKLFKSAVTNALGKYTEQIKSQIIFKIFSDQITEKIETLAGMDGLIPTDVQLSESDLDLVHIEETFTYKQDQQMMPNVVQHNVPAWTMFAMFFIVIPLGGSLIRERREGNLARLATMPVSGAVLILGKILVYTAVCLIQLILLLMIGLLIMPALGTPTLSLGTHPLAFLAVALSTALAACGFGMMVGAVARSHEQASTFSAIAIIIAAALGGIMMPVYLMPAFMQKVSAFSPLAWGLNAFLDIFLRNGDLSTVLPHVAKLFVFFLLALLIALFFLKFRKV